MKLDVTRIKLRWRELARGYPSDDLHTRALLEAQIIPNGDHRVLTTNGTYRAYSGSNGANDAIIDAIAEELTRVINEALDSLDATRLERLGILIAEHALKREAASSLKASAEELP